MYKKIFVISLILILAISMLLLPACGREDPTASVDLEAHMEGATLCWKAIEGASYTVKCLLSDGTGYSIKVTETSYIAPYTTPGDYAFIVTALDKEGSVITTSEKVTYHLGTGEAADVITIGSADDLMAVIESYSLTFGKTKVESPVYYRLTADIDLTGKSFTPIGTSSKAFKSVFDGAGHTIKGLNFTKCNTDGNIGLFGYTKNAVVKNLTLEGSVLFDKNSETKKGELNCGLLIGRAVSTLVDNCHVKGDIEILKGIITTDNYILSVGGIVGKAESGRISGVSYAGDISAQYGRTYAGGIVGFGQGDSPDLMILNAKSVANVDAVATSYNVETGTSYSYARAGIVVGNLSYAGRLASILAIGSATASSTKSGTPMSNLTAGVFGRTKTDTSAVTIPMYNIYYSDTVEKVVGSASSLGSYANYVYPLSEAQMKEKDSYVISGGRYGLDFDNYWDIPVGSTPTLKGTVTKEQPSLTLTVHSEIEGHEFHYDFLLEDVATPTYYDVSVGTTMHSLGYNLDELLDTIGTGITAVYTDDEIASGVSLRLSAEGIEDHLLTTTKTSLHCYLQYGVYSNYESREDLFGGFKIINTINSSNVVTYDYTTVDHITITYLPAGGTK